MGGARNGNLARRAFHQLPARELFDQIGVDRARTQQIDAMLEGVAASS